MEEESIGDPRPNNGGSLRTILRGLAELFMLARKEAPTQRVYAVLSTHKCTICGFRYSEHAKDPTATWIRELCNGRRVKL